MKNHSALLPSCAKKSSLLKSSCVKNLPFSLTLVMLLLLSGISQGQTLLLNENFDYTAGDALSAHSWGIQGAATPVVSVSASSITYPGYASSGVGNEVTLATSGQDVNKTFTQQTSGVVYASCLVNVTSSQTTGDYFFHLGATTIGTNFYGRVFIKKDAASSNYAFGISKNGAVGTAVFSPYSYSPGTTYLLVLKYSIVSGTANDSTAIYINPALNAAEPGSGWIKNSDVSGNDAANIGSVAFRQGSSTSAAALKVDGIRVATTWADIVGAVAANPPTWTSGWPKTEDANNNSFNAKVNISASGTAYYVVLPNAATAPSSAQVKAGQDASGTSLSAGMYGSISCAASGTEYIAAVSGLSSSTTYNVYFVAQDGSANLQTSPVMTSVTTTSTAVAPSISSPTSGTITSTSALLGGNITSDGGSPITFRGTVWSTTTGVTISDNYLADGNTTSGVFTQNRSSIPVKTQIFYKAFATNAIGTSTTSEGNFFTLATTPPYHVANFSALASSTTQIDLSWSAAAGCDGYLILKRTGSSAPTGTPSNATAYTAGTAIGNGTVVVDILSGNTSSYSVTGLSAMTAYSFIIVPYAFDGINYQTLSYNTAATIPSATATTLAPPAVTYTWNGGNGSYATATNWTPNRTTKLYNDILQFNHGGNDTLTAVTADTVGQIIISNNSNVNFQAAAAITYSIGGYTGIDFQVPAGSTFNLNGSSVITFKLLTSATADISGTMGLYAVSHKFDAVDTGSIIMENGSNFIQGVGCLTNVFTSTGTANIIRFKSGSTFTQMAGSNPFGISAPSSKVIFEDGSLFLLKQQATPSFSGRNYANFEMDAPGYTATVTGSTATSVKNLTVTNGILNFNMTGTPGHAIKGNIHIAAGASLIFSPAGSGTVNFNGSSAQSITGSGSIKIAKTATWVINNANGLNVNDSIYFGGTMNFNNGLVQLNANITLDSLIIAGTPSSSSMIVPNTYTIYNRYYNNIAYPVTFPIGVVEASTPKYLPVSISFTTGSFAANNYISLSGAAIKCPSDPSVFHYLKRYWNLNASGITSYTADASFQYLATDVHGTESLIMCDNFSTSPVTAYAAADTVLHKLSATGMTTLGLIGGGEAPVTARTLQVKLFLEGLFNSGTSNMVDVIDGNTGLSYFGTGITDKINIELREATAPYALVEAFNQVDLLNNGDASIQVPSAHNGDYYLRITNRNHLEIWSAVPLTFNIPSLSYDFSSGLFQAYGTQPQIQVASSPDYFAFYLGDLDQNGWIDSQDFNIFEPDLTLGTTGFSNADFNGGGWVDSEDFNLFEPRITLGNAAEYPGKRK